MDKHVKCLVAEQIGEVLIGSTIAIGLNKTVIPHCNTAEKVVVAMGAAVGGWMVGRAFGKKFFNWCDDVFDTEFNEDGELDRL